MRNKPPGTQHEQAGSVTGQVLYVCGGTRVGSLTLQQRQSGGPGNPAIRLVSVSK